MASEEAPKKGLSRKALLGLGGGLAALVIAASCATQGPPLSAESTASEPAAPAVSAAAPEESQPATPPAPRTVVTPPDLLVAFLGDQGNDTPADAVLELVKREGAAATVHNGDFDYDDDPNAWDDRVTRILGADYPYFAIVGNHDVKGWSKPGGYAQKVAERTRRAPEMKCTGELGVKARCNFRGLELIESCIGVNELRPSCFKDSAEQLGFIRDALASSDAVWNVCNWHKNQRDMQVGKKPDEVGYAAYRACMNAGAIIATGHEHSYSRTRTLSNLGSVTAAHGAMGAFDSIELERGKTFVFVSGLGGVGIRDFESDIHGASTWWASYYTENAWLMNGKLQNGTGTYGALFVRFHVDGDPKKARAYFKDVNGRIADTFTIQAK